MLGEMGKERGVSEMLEARGVVGHGIPATLEVLGGGAILVLPLVAASEAAKVGRGAVGGDRSSAQASHGRGVVREVMEGRVLDIRDHSDEVELSDQRSLFEVTIGDASGRVFSRDELGAAERVERGAPDARLVVFVEENSAHAR